MVDKYGTGQDPYSYEGTDILINKFDISKGNTRFCAGRFIESESQKLFRRIAKDNFLNGLSTEELIPKLAEHYSELNVIHPFRDGNGRAQRVLFEHIVVNTGHTISYELISKSDWIQANIDAYNCDYRALESIFYTCVSD